jgi:hypothetical protein
VRESILREFFASAGVIPPFDARGDAWVVLDDSAPPSERRAGKRGVEMTENRSAPEEEPRLYATADAGLVAWLAVCGIEPVGYRPISRRGGRPKSLAAACFPQTTELHAAIKAYHKTCLYGQHPQQDPETVTTPDVCPRDFVNAYRGALMRLRDEAEGFVDREAVKTIAGPEQTERSAL